VPVDGFWSISVYNEQGFFEKNDLGVYSINNVIAENTANGSYRIQFGGCQRSTANATPSARAIFGRGYLYPQFDDRAST
jgi:hypothetical protein